MIKEFNKQFHDLKPHISVNSGVKHAKFVDDPPLSVSEMYRRAVKGIPLSVPVQKDDRIPLNNRFYVDDFDVLDVSIRNDMRISEEERKKRLEENEFRKKEIQDYQEWKKQRQLESLNQSDVKKGE